MVQWTYEKAFPIPAHKIDGFWRRLQLRETFTRGVIFPYLVEFDADSQSGEFQSGELNIHCGPLLSAHGAIGEVSATYRGLQYYYGSYVLNFRWIRPVRLEFFRETGHVRLKITYYVVGWLLPFWKVLNWLFWLPFPISI